MQQEKDPESCAATLHKWWNLEGMLKIGWRRINSRRISQQKAKEKKRLRTLLILSTVMETLILTL
jgi:hypothetical protein